MDHISQNAKAYVAFAVTIATALLPQLAPDGTAHAVATAVIAIAGTFGVWVTPNADVEIVDADR